MVQNEQDEIVNPDKFQAIVLNKKRSDLTNTNFQVDNWHSNR